MNPILRHAIQKLFQITHRNECKNCIIRLAIEKVGGNMQILHLGKHFLAHKSTNLKKKKKSHFVKMEILLFKREHYSYKKTNH